MACRKLDQKRAGIYCWFMAVVIVLGMSAVVAWLSLTPKNPQFKISDPQFPSMDSTNGTMYRNISHANNSIIFDLEILNPNKRMGIYYYNITLQLYRGAVLGSDSTPGFYQGHKNTTVFQILIHLDEGFWCGANGGHLDFVVRVETTVRFRIVKWKTKLRRIVYEARFNDVKSSLNGTVSRGNHTELLTESKHKYQKLNR